MTCRASTLWVNVGGVIELQNGSQLTPSHTAR